MRQNLKNKAFFSCIFKSGSVLMKVQEKQRILIMSDINIDLRLRPVRFAFLVRPDDQERVLKIFQINTSLWGGKFNPIVPFFEEVPDWWKRDSRSFESAKQVINGYFDFFEPDFIVESEKGIAKNFNFDSKRILQFSDLMEYKETNDRYTTYGQSINDLYRYLYRTEFKFQLRNKQSMIYVEEDSKLKIFISCIFGSFSEKPEYLKENYKDVFDPKIIKLDAEHLKKIYNSRDITPLEIDHRTYSVNYGKLNPILFILNMEETKDLIDFWNLRTIYKNIFAIPIQWIKELSPFCKEFILNNYRLIRGNPYYKKPLQFTTIFSRSIDKKNIGNILEKYICVDEKNVNALQSSYPTIWRKSSELEVRKIRSTLIANRQYVEKKMSNHTIRFDPLSPKFADKYGNRFRWANVIRLTNFDEKRQIATIFPCNYKKDFPIKLKIRSGAFLSTTEGLVIFPENKSFSEFWNLIESDIVIKGWLQNNEKIETVELSHSGKIANQITQTLGISGRYPLINKDIIHFLNDISRKQLKVFYSSDFQKRINSAIKNNKQSKYIFKILIENNVVKLGRKIKCNRCGNWNWYSLKQLDYSLTCDLCLKAFPFPITQPSEKKHSKWAYRIVGPFALPNYAQGGYAVALSVRFFKKIIDGHDEGVTWSSGQELTVSSNQKIEIDFILWFQRSGFGEVHYPTNVVFGEAKSFGKDAFTQEDIDKMKSLAEIFPGAILVFATMREPEALTEEEIKLIRELAEWGREYDKERQQTRSPIIVLTGIELFTKHHLDITWKEKGGAHEQLANRSSSMMRISNLRFLANYTQQLYLDMPSYDEWVMKKTNRGKVGLYEKKD